MVSKLSREQIQAEAEHIPISSLLGKSAKRELTPRQKNFARQVAMGKSKAQAYRDSYGADKAARTITSRPYIMMQDERIKREIEALELAERSAAYRTPARLREHVIKSLLEVTLDPEVKAAVRVQALKVLGTVTEVAAFTERKEVRSITSTEQARAAVLEEIKAIMSGTDDVVDVQAKSLLDELTAGNVNKDQPDDQHTPPQYDDAQVIDSYRADLPEVAESAGKHGLVSPKTGKILGGVSEEWDGGDPTVPHPPAV